MSEHYTIKLTLRRIQLLQTGKHSRDVKSVLVIFYCNIDDVDDQILEKTFATFLRKITSNPSNNSIYFLVAKIVNFAIMSKTQTFLS